MATSGTDQLRESENSALSGAEQTYYSGSGRSSSDNSKSFQGRIKSAIVMIIAVGGITAGAFTLSSTNSLLGPALSANVTEETSLQDTSSQLRTIHIFRAMLKGQDLTTTSWTGAKKYSTLPQKSIERFEKNDIEVESNSDSNSKTLVYDNKNGKRETISADEFPSKVRSDVDFRESYQNSRRTNIVNFFDQSATNFYRRFGDIRNWFKNFKDTNEEKENKKNYEETSSKHFDDAESNYTNNGKRIVDYDEDGNPIIKWEEGTKGTGSTSSTDIADAEVKAQSYIAGISSQISDQLSGACVIMRVGNMISATVSAMDRISYMKYFLGQVESISKMMAGEGSSAPINEVLNFLTTSTTAEVDDIQNLTFGGGNVEGGGKIVTNGAPVEASGLQLQLSNIKTNAASAAPYSVNRTGSAVSRALAMTGTTATGCAAMDVVTSVASIATTITNGIPKVVASLAVSLVAKEFVNFGVSAVIGFLVPVVAQSLFNNMFDTLEGIPAGHAMAAGASIGNMWLSRAGSALMPSTAEKVQEFARAQTTVIAMNAEIDRKNRSPFDITSRNTFLGSIVNSLMPTIYSSRVSSVTALIKSSASSIASLNAFNVLADSGGDNQRYIDVRGQDCSDLNRIGATGSDMYCSNINTSDMSMISVMPNDEKYAKFVASQMESCDGEGNCTIAEDSTLDRFIRYCVNRQSPFGVLDTNILDDLSVVNIDEGSGLISKLFKKVVDFLSNLPIVEDIWDMADAMSSGNPTAVAWANGEMCVNNDSDTWNNEMKYAQLYVMDQRILEQAGAYEGGENPVEVAYERYLEQHPLDDSPAGVLARYAGIRKEDSELVIAMAEYYNFIQDYDPSTRIAMDGDTSIIKTSTDIAAEAHSDQNKNRFDTQKPSDRATTIIALIRPTIIYADLRTRSYAA